MDRSRCDCPRHPWTRQEVEAAIQAAIPKACDLAWSGVQNGSAPCHARTPIGNIRVSAWGAGFRLFHRWYPVIVGFGPCRERPLGPPVGHPPLRPGDPPAAPGGSPSGDPVPVVVDPPFVIPTEIEPLELDSTPINDPALTPRLVEIAFSMGVPPGGLLVLPTLVLGYALDAAAARRDGFADAYWSSSPSFPPPYLPSGSLLEGWAILAGSTPGGGPLPPPPPPGCGMLGIEFLAALGLAGRLLGRRSARRERRA
jgi:hypothetical protein